MDALSFLVTINCARAIRAAGRTGFGASVSFSPAVFPSFSIIPIQFYRQINVIWVFAFFGLAPVCRIIWIIVVSRIYRGCYAISRTYGFWLLQSVSGYFTASFCFLPASTVFTYFPGGALCLAAAAGAASASRTTANALALYDLNHRIAS